MSTLLLIYLLCTLPKLSRSDIIWSYAMDTAIPNEWTQTGLINTYTSQPNCPSSQNYCWSIQDTSTLTLTPRSTAGYHTISLTYAASTFNVNGQDRCTIKYTTDGTTISSNYQNIVTYNTNTPSDKGTFNEWGTLADDNADGISIQLQSTSSNSVQCYFNHFIITGTKITAQPTISPTLQPSLQPTIATPTKTPTTTPTVTSWNPTKTPTRVPTLNTVTGTKITAQPTISPTLQPSLQPTTATPTVASWNPTKNPTRMPTFNTVTPTGSPTPSPTDIQMFEEISAWEWPFSVPSIIIVYVIIAWFILFCCVRSWLMKLLLLIYGQPYESRVVGKRITFSKKGGSRFYLSYELCGTVRNKQVTCNTFNEFQEDSPIRIKLDPFCPTYNHKVYAYYNGWIVCLCVILIYLCMGGIVVGVLYGIGILNANKIQNAQNATQEGAVSYYEEEGQNYIYYNPQLLFYSICFGMFLCFLTIACQCGCGQHCGKTKADLIDHSQTQNDGNNQTVQAQMMPVVYQPVVDPNQANMVQAHAQAPSIIYVQPAFQPQIQPQLIQPQPSAPEDVDENVESVAIQCNRLMKMQQVEGNESNVNDQYVE